MATNDNKSNVVEFTGLHYGELPVETILETAKGQMKTCVVIGWDNDGLEYFSSSTPDKREILYLLKKAEMFVMREDN